MSWYDIKVKKKKKV